MSRDVPPVSVHTDRKFLTPILACSAFVLTSLFVKDFITDPLVDHHRGDSADGPLLINPATQMSVLTIPISGSLLNSSAPSVVRKQCVGEDVGIINVYKASSMGAFVVQGNNKSLPETDIHLKTVWAITTLTVDLRRPLVVHPFALRPHTLDILPPANVHVSI